MSGYQFAPLRQPEDYLVTPKEPASESSSAFVYVYPLSNGSKLAIVAWQPCDNQGLFMVEADYTPGAAGSKPRHAQICAGLNADVAGSGVDVSWSGRLIESPAHFELSSPIHEIPEPEVFVHHDVPCDRLPHGGKSMPCREGFEMASNKPGETRQYAMIAIVVLLFIILCIMCSK